jgi:glyoxylase-like metal-dependent hydrolase (beta-lactamase superfamily II)
LSRMNSEVSENGAADVHGLHDAATGTVTYILWDRPTRTAAVIDPVLDYEPRTSRTGSASVEAVTRWIDQHRLELRWILETHIHADHLSGAARLRALRGGEVCIGSGVRAVRERWNALFPGGKAGDDIDFDRLLDDGARLELGKSHIKVAHTPGHTPSCVTYSIDDIAFVGDALFTPEEGTGRCDFPGGGARLLFSSIRKIFELPAGTRLFSAHAYGDSEGGAVNWSSTVAEQRQRNVHIRDGVTEDEFVRLRTARDRTLAPPALMWAAVQVNLRGGRLPNADANGVSYLRVPVDVKLD